jgi:hypothetical protein
VEYVSGCGGLVGSAAFLPMLLFYFYSNLFDTKNIKLIYHEQRKALRIKER